MNRLAGIRESVEEVLDASMSRRDYDLQVEGRDRVDSVYRATHRPFSGLFAIPKRSSGDGRWLLPPVAHRCDKSRSQGRAHHAAVDHRCVHFSLLWFPRHAQDIL